MMYAIRLVRVASFLCLIGIVGCTNLVQVDSTDRQLIQDSTTWTFLKNDPPLPQGVDRETSGFTYRVTSPSRNAARLDSKVARRIEDALARRGFEYVERDADLYVQYRLSLRPQRNSVERAFAERYVPSHSFTPSYVVEGTDIVEIEVEELRFEMNIREARGRVLWTGVYEDTLPAKRTLSVDEWVDDLTSRLPERGPRATR